MTQAQRVAKRWKRENRAKNTTPKPMESCRQCGHKLTRYGCPNCNPSIWSIGDDMVRRGDLMPEALALVAAIGSRRGM